MIRPAARLPASLTALAFLICSGLPAIGAEHPADLRQFLERRAECDHWRGEASGDPERQRDIDRAACRTCTGADAELAKFKKKFKTNAAAMSALDDLEVQIERPDKAAAQRFCRRVLRDK